MTNNPDDKDRPPKSQGEKENPRIPVRAQADMNELTGIKRCPTAVPCRVEAGGWP